MTDAWPDLKRLFRPLAFPRSRFTGGLEVEIESVRIGDKPIAMFAFSESALADDTMYQELRTKSLAAGLLLIHQPSEETVPEICVFICREGHAWRVHALMALRHCLSSSYHPYERFEYLESYLLGYSETEIEEWFDRQRERKVNAEGVTLYLLMSAQHAAALDDLGMRALSPESLAQPMLAFYLSGLVVISPDASNLLGQRILGRVAIKAFALKRIFGESVTQRRDELHSRTLSTTDAKHLNHALQSRIEVWDKGQWR